MRCMCCCSHFAACRTSSWCCGSAEMDAMEARSSSWRENASLFVAAYSLQSAAVVIEQRCCC
jgi:hypothetical protein